jgi:Chitobiase/beta-hexosaminidase C-terminal domain
MPMPRISKISDKAYKRNLGRGILLLAVTALLGGCGSPSKLTTAPETPAATPTFSVPGGTYTTTQTVTISCSTPGCAISYTTNGSTPSATSTVYTGPIVVSKTQTVKAMGFALHYLNSGVGAVSYTIHLPQAATPTFSLPGGTYSGLQTVSISDATPGVQIYYTINGGTPSASSTLYTGPITVQTTQTIRAIAVEYNYADSAVGAATYKILAATPAFSVPGGVYTSPQTVSISDSTTGAKIYYTTNGSTPSASSTLYSGPITVSTTETIKAIASASGYSNSFVASAAYTLSSSSPASNEWAAVNGSSGPANFGTQGAFAADNTPGKRYEAVRWTDSNGKLWLLGGTGVDANGNPGALNDLWEFDPAANQWAWINGSKTNNSGCNGKYGTLGVPDGANVPGCRGEGTTWTDSNGKLWLFGGLGYDSTNTVTGSLNDLWMFDPTASNSVTGVNGVWTWMGGSDTYPLLSGAGTGRPGVYNTKGATKGSSVPGARVKSGSFTEANGNLWLFGGQGYDASGTLGMMNDLWEFLPTAVNTVTGANGVWVWMGGSSAANSIGTNNGTPAATPGSRYAMASWTDAHGRFWIFGGYGNAPGAGTDLYLSDLWRFDPTAANSATGLNGVWRYAGTGSVSSEFSGRWPAERWNPVSWTDNSGYLWLYGGDGHQVDTAAPGSGWVENVLDDLWRYNPATFHWTSLNGNYVNSNGSASTKPCPPPSDSAYPGYIVGASSWTDVTGKFWLFTGTAGVPDPVANACNTMWTYDPSPEAVPAPVLSPHAGTYTTPQTVTITDADADATIYYTTNNTTPTTSSSKYTAPITVSKTERINAVAIKNAGYTVGDVASALYTIPIPQTAATPTFSYPSGTYSSALSVAIADATTGAKIYYTTDGSTPTTSSTKYTGPIAVSTSMTIKAIAAAAGYQNSAVASVSYTIQ